MAVSDETLRGMPKFMLERLRDTAYQTLFDIDTSPLSTEEREQKTRNIGSWLGRIHDAIRYEPPSIPRVWSLLKNPEV